MSVPETDPNPSLELPPQLARELKAEFGRTPVVPPAIDDRLRHEARERLGVSTTQSPARLRLLPQWLAAAAAIVVAAVLMWFPVRSRSDKGRSTQAADLNGDGRVDILDSFQLARRLQQRERLAAALDLNGDGVVDAKDVEALTARIVQLGKEKG